MTTSLLHRLVVIPQLRAHMKPPRQRDTDPLPVYGAFGRTVTTLCRGAAEPDVGKTLRKGAPVGRGDSVQFYRIDDGPSGWQRIVNGSIVTDFVSWEHVASYLPMDTVS